MIGATLTLFLTINFLSLVRGQHVLGDSCSSNDRCAEIDSSWCYVASPTCGSGYCACRPGFVQVYNKTGCYAAKRLGSKCAFKDVCTDPNSECYNGICTCSSGFTASSYNGGVCVSQIKNLRAGEKCFDSVQCVGSLVCVENKCGCYPEYSMSGCCDCVRKMYGEQCSDNADCIHSANSICQRGKCLCDYNSKVVYYLTMTDHRYGKYQVETVKCLTKAACVSQYYELGNEGDLCSEPDPKDPSQSFRLCKPPFVCTPCSSFKKVCALRPAACYRILQSGAPAQLTAAFVVAVLAIASIVSLLFDIIN